MVTEKDKSVLILLSNGFTSKQAGDYLGVSQRTIEKRVEFLKLEMEAKNTTQLIATAIRNKVIE